MRRCYAHWGVRGLLRTDACCCFGASVLLAAIYLLYWKGHKTAYVEAVPGAHAAA
jgi:hypothetical protein